mgnify:FL=1
MMRLIDEEDVISLLVSHHFDDDKKNYDSLIHNLCNEVKRIPTAYDVDEVVDRLEATRDILDEEMTQTYIWNRAISESIKIVKADRINEGG